MGLTMKNFNIFGVHGKIPFLRGGVNKKPIQRGELPKKVGGLGQFADLGWGLARKRGVAFLRGGVYPNAHYVRQIDMGSIQ